MGILKSPITIPEGFMLVYKNMRLHFQQNTYRFLRKFKVKKMKIGENGNKSNATAIFVTDLQFLITLKTKTR
jgi:hypothetical protein